MVQGAKDNPLILLNWNVFQIGRSYVIYKGGEVAGNAFSPPFIDGTFPENQWKVLPGKTYTYQVSSFDVSQKSDKSSVITVTTSKSTVDTSASTKVSEWDSTPPKKSISSSENLSVTDPQSRIVSYRIYRDGLRIADVDGKESLIYSDTGLEPDTMYTYQISAINGLGLESPKSRKKQIATLPMHTAPPVISVIPEAITLAINSPVPNLLKGVTATDYNNSSINDKIVTTGSVDSSVTGDYIISYDVTDNAGKNSLTKTRTYSVSDSAAVNKSPTIGETGNIIISENGPLQTVTLSGITAGAGENQTLTVVVSSNNPDLIPHPTVNYLSPETTGKLTFTPVASTIGTATITVTVRDDGDTAFDGGNTVTITFDVIVTAVNHAPILDPIGDRFVKETQELTFIATANDNDRITNNLCFSLDNDTIDLGASINETTGVFSWIPTNAQGPKIHKVTITVTDDGIPALSDSKELKITVNDPSAIILELQKGWNLRSISKEPQDNSIENIFGNKIIGVVWGWDNANRRLEAASEITSTKGYWVFSRGDFLNENAIVISLP